MRNNKSGDGINNDNVRYVGNVYSTKLSNFDVGKKAEAYAITMCSVGDKVTGIVFEMKPGRFEYGYDHDEVFLVFEGEVRIQDQISGKIIDLRKGDLIQIYKEAKLNFVSDKGFKCWAVTC